VVRREVMKVGKFGARHWLGALALALPAVLFLPGIGFQTSHPAALARKTAAPAIWYYRVRDGESLSTISERELGTFKRYKEILALNPGIEPRKLPAGDVLRMPPRAQGAKDQADPALVRTASGPAPDSLRLLLSIAGLLGLVLLIVSVTSRLERRASA